MSAVTVATTPRLRLLPVPVAEPRPALRIVPERGTPAPAPNGRRRREAPADRDEGRVPDPGLRQATAPAAAWTRQFVQTALEAAGGRRPVSQLLRWSSDDVYSLLARRASLAARLDRGAGGAAARCAVRSVHLRPLQAGVIEACAVVSDRGRFRAVALRLEDTEGRWRVTAFEIG